MQPRAREAETGLTKWAWEKDEQVGAAGLFLDAPHLTGTNKI